jgi:hypothetical protein
MHMEHPVPFHLNTFVMKDYIIIIILIIINNSINITTIKNIDKFSSQKSNCS